MLICLSQLGKAKQPADMVGGVLNQTREEKSHLLSRAVPLGGKNPEIYRKKVT